MRTLKMSLAGASLSLLLGADPSPALAASPGNAVWLERDPSVLIEVGRPGHYPHVRPHPHPGRHPGFHPGPRPRPWVRPPHYHWRPGAAVAAGAAIGFVAAATAAAWAGPPPAPGMCWYYTNRARTQGYWDYCP